MNNFKLIAEGVEVSRWMEVLRRHPNLWKIEQGRQQYPGSSHKETETIFLRGPKVKTVEGLQEDIFPVSYPELTYFYQPLVELWDLVDEKLDVHRYGMLMITRLPPGGKIYLHKDEGKYAEYFDRLHLVLKDGGKDLFRCGEEVVRLETGELWRFDHRKEHRCSNEGTGDRIHLIMDLKLVERRK